MVVVFQVFQAVTPGRRPLMLHLLHKRPVQVVEQSLSTFTSEPPAPPPILITEQEVLFATAAAAAIPPPVGPHHHWPDVPHLHMQLPKPRPTYPGREAGYFETARMSRAMEHL